MKLGDTTKAIWLWLRARGGHWTVQQIDQHTGLGGDVIFDLVHAMTRRRLVEQVDPLPGSRRMRYGVTESCIVPLGLTVREACTGLSRPAPARPTAAPVAPVPAGLRHLTGLSDSELAYAHMAHRLEQVAETSPQAARAC